MPKPMTALPAQNIPVDREKDMINIPAIFQNISYGSNVLRKKS